ncbi:MAG: ABC transporter permease [Gemmatimonas sp.]
MRDIMRHVISLDAVRRAVRAVVRTPLMNLMVLLSLAVGIALCLVASAIARSLDFSKQGIQNAARLTVAGELTALHCSSCVDLASPSTLDILRRGAGGAIRHAGAFRVGELAVGTDAYSARATVVDVSPDVFDMLGVVPMAGRLPQVNDLGADVNARPVVLSYAFWKAAFHGASAVVGRTVMIDGTQSSVVAIAGKHLSFPSQAAIWRVQPAGVFTSVGAAPVYLLLESVDGLSTIRVRDAVARAATTGNVVDRTPRGAWTRTLAQFQGDSVGSQHVVLAIAAWFTLAVAYINIAHLYAVRTLARSHEFSVRLAVGASRGHLTGMLALEGLVVALPAAALGVLGASASVNAAGHLFSARTGVVVNPAISLGETGLAVLLSLVFGLCAAVAPSLLYGADRTATALRGGAGITGVRGAARVRRAMLAVQIAVTSALLCFAVLFVSSLISVRVFDLGYRAKSLAWAAISPSRGGTLTVTDPSSDPRRLRWMAEAGVASLATAAALDGLEQQLGRSLGARTVGVWAPTMIPRHYEGLRVDRAIVTTDDGQALLDDQAAPIASFDVSPPVLSVLGLRLRAGRFIGEEDRFGTEPVAVVNESAAAAMWPKQNPIGRRFKLGGTDSAGTWLRVVGVVGDAAMLTPEGLGLALINPKRKWPAVFRALRQTRPRRLFVASPLGPNSAASLESLRLALLQVAEPSSLEFIGPMDAQLRRSWMLPMIELRSQIVGICTAAGLLLSLLAILTATADAARDRQRELALRSALGASRKSLITLVLAPTSRIAAYSVTCGAFGALVVAQLFSDVLFMANKAMPNGMLYGASAADWKTFILAALLMVLLSLLAALSPAMTASRADPASVLRS